MTERQKFNQLFEIWKNLDQKRLLHRILHVHRDCAYCDSLNTIVLAICILMVGKTK